MCLSVPYCRLRTGTSEGAGAEAALGRMRLLPAPLLGSGVPPGQEGLDCWACLQRNVLSASCFPL